MLKVLPFLFLPLLFVFADWPQYHGPLFNKSTESSSIGGNKLQISSQLMWKSPTPLGFSSFSIQNDLAFTLVAEEDEDGLLREVCIALDMSSGRRTWQQNLGIASYGHAGGNAGTRDNSGGDGPRSTPSVKYGRVFIYDSAMVLHCLSAKSGKPMWQVDVIDDHDGENIIYHGDINLGIAVAVDWGLLVPVVHNADDLSMVGLSKKIADLGNRSRGKKLKPDEVQGLTFSITNPGIFGSQWGTPIIPQPSVAIMGVGTIEKRVKVLTLPDGSDTFTVKLCGYLTLGFDHRVIDGAVADQFMSHVKNTLETFDESAL